MPRKSQTDKKELCRYLYYGQGITNYSEIARRVQTDHRNVRRWIHDSPYSGPIEDKIKRPEKSTPTIGVTNVYVENPKIDVETQVQNWEESTLAKAIEYGEQTRNLRLNLYGRMQACNDSKEFNILANSWKIFFDIEYKINSMEYLDINRAADLVVKHRVELDAYQ